MQSFTRLMGFVCALVLAGLACAAPPTAEERAAREEQKRVARLVRAEKAAQSEQQLAVRTSLKEQLKGPELEANAEKLATELAWQTDLDVACQAAKAAGKPVLWIQALGELDGYL